MDKSRGKLGQLIQGARAQSVGTLRDRLEQSGLLDQQEADHLVSEMICTGSHTNPFEEPSSGCPIDKSGVKTSFRFRCEIDPTRTTSEINAAIVKATPLHFRISPNRLPKCRNCGKEPDCVIKKVELKEISFLGKVEGPMDLEDN